MKLFTLAGALLLTLALGIVAGTPETVAKCAQSHTGKALREHIKIG